MGMDIHIVGLRDLDAKAKDMVDIAEKCTEMGVSIPKEVEDYLGEALEYDDVLEHLKEVSLGSAVVGNAMYNDGAFIDLSKVPDDITHIKVGCLV